MPLKKWDKSFKTLLYPNICQHNTGMPRVVQITLLVKKPLCFHSCRRSSRVVNNSMGIAKLSNNSNHSC